ncbi:unnamed protein product [Tuber aestivum]|uniref:Cell wall mannoprotein PIR1-like C-terminal domain-containing protein n=1 Tax=Tuber aestivum TaxID=59557 RepID=A0A292Q5Q7_9PEZI|nr:unnamed protein product [Tuber aestivum]
MPTPQGVTALLTPGAVLDNCVINFPGVHGISIQPADLAAGVISAAGSGTGGGAGGVASAVSAATTGDAAENPRRRRDVTQISDGQIQVVPVAGHTGVAAPGSVWPAPAIGAVTQIPDGQIQAPCAAYPDAAADAVRVVTQIDDGQIQAPCAAYPGAAADAVRVVTQIDDGQIQAPGAAETVTQIADGQVQGPQKHSTLKTRQNGYPLQVTLKDGVLTDILGRIGYIADNRQLQFDAPPQAGAIYTGGFSACPDGTLALGSSNVFYACGSSDFTNLYDTLVYPDNCRPVKLYFR